MKVQGTEQTLYQRKRLQNKANSLLTDFEGMKNLHGKSGNWSYPAQDDLQHLIRKSGAHVPFGRTDP
jgi:hypothetical protein